jgi:hypothetical protein
MQAKQYLNPGSPKGEKRAVAPGRRPNTVYRKREHLTPAEVAKLIDCKVQPLRPAGRDHGQPSCAEEIVIAPSVALGHKKRPRSNRLVNRQAP